MPYLGFRSGNRPSLQTHWIPAVPSSKPLELCGNVTMTEDFGEATRDLCTGVRLAWERLIVVCSQLLDRAVGRLWGIDDKERAHLDARVGTTKHKCWSHLGHWPLDEPYRFGKTALGLGHLFEVLEQCTVVAVCFF